MLTAGFRNRLETALWSPRPAQAPPWKRRLLRFSRTLAVLFRDNAQGQLTLRAMGLVYTTLLSLVPLLALSFSVLKAFGVHNQIQPFLQGVLAPLGENSEEITSRIILFIQNMNVGVLGSMGLGLLLFTAVSLVQKVEEAFNYIWHVSRARTFGERFSRYLSLLLVGPILVFSALGITASVMNAGIVRNILDIEPFGEIFIGLSRLMPYVLVIVAFTFAYYFIPNTRVRPTAALLGGLVAGIGWQTAGWAFAEFAASSGQYRAIYSSFAILILFMIWLYLSWRILLFGASVAFYCQHPEYVLAGGGEPQLSNRMREGLALGIMELVSERFLAGQPPLAAEELARQMRVPADAIAPVLEALEGRRFIVQAGGSGAYLPTRDLDGIALAELVEAVRSAGEDGNLSPDSLPLPPRVEELLRRLDQALESTLAGMSAADLAAPPDRRKEDDHGIENPRPPDRRSPGAPA